MCLREKYKELLKYVNINESLTSNSHLAFIETLLYVGHSYR